MGCGSSSEVNQPNGEVKGGDVDSPSLNHKDSIKQAEDASENITNSQKIGEHRDKMDEHEDDDDASKYRPPKGGILVMPLLPVEGFKFKNRLSKVSVMSDDSKRSIYSDADVEKIKPTVNINDAEDEDDGVSKDLPSSESMHSISQLEEDDTDQDSDTQESPKDIQMKEENFHNAFVESYTGLKTVVLDTRRTKPPKIPPPIIPSDKLWHDPEFPKDFALEGIDVELEWKRPGEIVDNPVLFDEGTTRFDIGQGAAGTCWYLSVLAAIADMPDLIKLIIPDNAYDQSTGVFHCKFWKFGEWVDVYIDDCLPVLPADNSLWGAKSATDSNEMWPSLMEKAFAKFHGSYSRAAGGDASLGYINLTGGIAESMDTQEVRNRHGLFKRVQNALGTGSVIACTVPEEHWGTHGLIGKHAYSLTGAAKIPYKGKNVPLFRIRNPWGKDKGEWIGPWGDGTEEWDKIPPWIKNKLQVVKLDDGEFWMNLDDFFTYFNKIHICNLLPDLDQDGLDDGLKYTSNIFGEWRGSTAGGCKLNRMKNPKYLFSVPDSDPKIDGKVPVVLQFFQHRAHRRDDGLFYMRADLFSIASQSGNNICLRDITNYKNYYGGYEKTYRYLLDPGAYLLMPTTMNEKEEKQFLMRIFSSSMILACSLPYNNPCLFVTKSATIVKKELKFVTLDKVQNLFGFWKCGLNSGGQTSHKIHGTNPQYLLTVNDAWASEPTALVLSLMQQNVGEKFPIGYKLYKLNDEESLPLSTAQIHGKQNNLVATVDGKTVVFVIAYEGSATFILAPGKYAVVCFLDTPSMEKPYAFSVASHYEVNVIGYQTGA